MNRYLAPILVGLLLAGCAGQGQTPTSDPFLAGRTRIPPPGTGAATGTAADPYGPASASPAWRPSGTVAAPAGTTLPPTTTGVPLPGSAPLQGPLPGTPSTSPATGVPSPGAGTSPPGFTSKAPGGSGVTAPPATTIRSAWPGASAADSRSMPADSGSNYRGIALQGSRAAVATPEFGVSTGTGGNRASTALDNRIPRPVDSGNPSGNPATGQPPVRNLQPPAKDDGSSRVMNLVDLPAAM
jgi:hypothetical protein